MIVDILIGIAIGVGGFYGYKKGLLVELITLLAFILALISAFKLLHTTLIFLKPYISSGSFAVLLSFIIIFTLVFGVIYFLGKFLKNNINYTILGTIDSFAGCVIGCLKAAFAISMVLWLFHNARLNQFYGEYTSDSFLYPYILNFGPEMVQWVSHVIPLKDIFPSIKKLLKPYDQ